MPSVKSTKYTSCCVCYSVIYSFMVKTKVGVRFPIWVSVEDYKVRMYEIDDT